MKKITEELNRYNSINQYISEQYSSPGIADLTKNSPTAAVTATPGIANFPKKAPVAANPVKNINPDENRKTTNDVKQPLNKGKDGVINPNNPIELDGVTIQGKPKQKTNPVLQKTNPTLQQTNPVLQQTISLNNQIQQKMGVKQTGKLTHTDLENLIKMLTPKA